MWQVHRFYIEEIVKISPHLTLRSSVTNPRPAATREKRREEREPGTKEEREPGAREAAGGEGTGAREE